MCVHMQLSGFFEEFAAKSAKITKQFPVSRKPSQCAEELDMEAMEEPPAAVFVANAISMQSWLPLVIVRDELIVPQTRLEAKVSHPLNDQQRLWDTLLRRDKIRREGVRNFCFKQPLLLFVLHTLRKGDYLRNFDCYGEGHRRSTTRISGGLFSKFPDG